MRYRQQNVSSCWQKHPHFDLWLHDNQALGAVLGSPIVQRMTIHEWPLSCVQRICDEKGNTYIYKVQTPPTVEPTFYPQARSPLLVKAKVLPCGDGPAALLLEDVQAPHLSELPLDEASRSVIVEDILLQIGQISGDLPALLDIRTPEQWLVYGQTIIQNLRILVEEHIFQKVNTAQIEQILAQIQSPTVLATFDGPTGYVHSDLWGQNILALDDGYRVLDWQRPIWGPTALDRLTLLKSVGLDPASHISVGIGQLRTLLQIGWFAEAARWWFPTGASTYEQQIFELAGQLVG